MLLLSPFTNEETGVQAHDILVQGRGAGKNPGLMVEPKLLVTLMLPVI